MSVTAGQARRLVAIAVLIIGLPVCAGAHRLDEYLQAARIDIAARRVVIDLDLTPGANIASQVARWIDADGDSRVSPAERDAYAQEALSSLAVSVDAKPLRLRIVDFGAPEPREMTAGIGRFHLRAAADFEGVEPGAHRLTFTNSHHPELSVYLANALVPDDRRIAIVAQQRPRDQHSLTVEYALAGGSMHMRLAWLFGGLGSVAALAVGRRFRTARTPPA